MGEVDVWYFLPKTTLGRCSAWLIAAFFLLFIVLIIISASGQTGGDTLTDNLYLSIPAMLAGLCAISAFISGIISIIWKKEKAITVFLSTGIGLLLLMFLAGEFLVPH